MKIPVGGIQKHSLIDYPGNISAVIFTCGCNFRCNYCHNSDLVYPGKIAKLKKLNLTDIIDWLKEHKNLLDAVVITGGEPTIHPYLPGLIIEIKKTGLKVKLDTNGTNPGMLNRIISDGIVDYLAMDVKASLCYEAYKTVVGDILSPKVFSKVKESVRIINESTIEHEYRTTLEESVTISDIKSIISLLKGNYYLQRVRDEQIASDMNGHLKFNHAILEELNSLNPDLCVQIR